MKRKNILLTGGHSGMGLELTKMLLEKGHKIGLILRGEKRKNEAIKELGNTPQIDYFFADLAKRNEIESVVLDVAKAWKKVDGLFNNAGVLLDKLHFSEYGNELQLEVNAISPYLLTKALIPLMDDLNETPFVVNTATSGLDKKESVDIQEFKNPKKFVKLFGSYIDSKLTMVLLMKHLSTKNDDIRILSVDPGAIKTKMTAGKGMPFWLKPIRNLLFKSPEEGAQNLYDAAFGYEFMESGIYVSKGKIKKLAITLKEVEIDELLN